MTHQKRRLKNFLLDPARQLRSAVHFLGLYVIYSVFLSAAFLYVTFDQHSFVMAHLGRSSNASFFDMFQNPIIVQGLVEASVLFLVFLVIAAIMTVVFSHRVYGPLIPIKRQLEAMLEGDYSQRIALRKKDELRDIADAINRLSDRLEAKESGMEQKNVISAIKELNQRLDEREVVEIG